MLGTGGARFTGGDAITRNDGAGDDSVSAHGGDDEVLSQPRSQPASRSPSPSPPHAERQSPPGADDADDATMEVDEARQIALSAAAAPELAIPDTFVGDFGTQLKIFYAQLFPFKEFYKWLSYGNVQPSQFANREFSFTLASDAYLRFQSFKDAAELKQEVMKLSPVKIDIGAVYNSKPKDRKLLRPGVFNPVERELVFDIDLTDYNSVRTCCGEADICLKCWTFVTVAIKVIDRALKDDFGFMHRFWVYSGRRGVHCWVCDERARKLTAESRKAIVSYIEVIKGGDEAARKVQLSQRLHPSLRKSLDILEPAFKKRIIEDQDLLRLPAKWRSMLATIPDEDSRKRLDKFWSDNVVEPSEKWEQIVQVVTDLSKKNRKVHAPTLLNEIIFEYSYPRIDANVSHGLNHLLKSPFCVHPKTGKVCVPIDPAVCEKFDPTAVPTLSTLIQEINESKADPKDTSLEPHVQYFRDFLKRMEGEAKEARAKRRDEAEQTLAF